MDLTEYLPAKMTTGEHRLKITEAGICQSESGTTLCRVWLRNEKGASFGQNFAQTPRALPCLAGFCIACGLTEQQLKDFAPSDLVDREVIGNVYRNDDSFWAMKSWRPIPPREDQQPGMPDLF